MRAFFASVLVILASGPRPASSRCSGPIPDLPFCRGVSTTAPALLVESIRLINKVPSDLLQAQVQPGGGACTQRTCVDSAKGVLCLALNGGVAAASVLSQAVAVKGPIAMIEQFAMHPPAAGLAWASPDNQSLAIVLPEQPRGEGPMFCMNGVPSREHPPCFTQCVDLVTPACTRQCSLPIVGPSEAGVAYSNPLPCLLTEVPSNPVCKMRAGERFVVDVRMEPWAACYRPPFVVPRLRDSSDPQVCAGRVPQGVTEVDLVFDCARSQAELCKAGNGVHVPALQDPFLQLTMALADFLHVNPLYVWPSSSGRWSTQGYPATINNFAANRVVTAHFRVFMDRESTLYEEERVEQLMDAKDRTEQWNSFLAQKLILPEGVTVKAFNVIGPAQPVQRNRGAALAPGPQWGWPALLIFAATIWHAKL